MAPVLYEMRLVLLVIFSLVMPIAIYAFLYIKKSISRWSVILFAVLLLVVSGLDVVLLQHLSQKAHEAKSLLHDRFFSEEISLVLYLLPAVFAGLGVNILSHVLINHLNEAESRYASANSRAARQDAAGNAAFTRLLSQEPAATGMFLLSLAVIALIFYADFVSGSEIRLHVLYVFPLAILARYCARLGLVLAALVGTTILQIITFANEAVQTQSFVTDILVALAASMLIVVLARKGRQAYMMALNLAATDVLTDIPNRRCFMGELASAVARQTRYGGVFSLAILDFDGFKRLNDTLGHAAGDNALKLAAELLRGNTRKSDALGRLGGDEFAVLLPNTGNDSAAAMLQQLREAIAQKMAQAGYAITVSIGCKTFQSAPESSMQALHEADNLLYEAKGRGKNQAVFAA